jgi:tetratricopeptide (TPR) repeat protein
VKRAVFSFLFACFFFASVYAQQDPISGHTVIVFPFDNTSSSPSLEWLGECFPSALESHLDSPVLYVVTRDERLRAYDRQGVPSGVHPSRATLYRIAEQMDVDFAVFGSYSYDGARLTATAQLLDMRAQKLLPAAAESAPLFDLAIVQSTLAWDLLHSIHPNFTVSKDRYISSFPAMQLDALESYTHGVLAATAEEKIQNYREATRLNLSFPEAWLALGKAYFAERSYEQAGAAFEKIPPSSRLAREANFYLGLSAYAHGDFDKAERAFEFVAARVPLAEVYNNLGVVAARRGPGGQRRAAEDFEKAIENDPSNPDYHFNLGVTLARAGDKAKAGRELRLDLDARPTDSEAKNFLDSLALPGPAQTATASSAPAQAAPASPAKIPAERLTRTYQENAFRQMTTQMQGWAEQRFARSDPRSHARYHVELGNELLAHGFTTEAEAEFRHAATVDPASPAPLAALAEVYDARGDAAEARTQAEASLHLHESAAAYLVLARLDLRENRTASASDEIARALQLEPRNLTAQDLKRTLAAKLAEKAQPLPQP